MYFHPARAINLVSAKIADGRYDEAIESLALTLKTLQLAISGDAKIHICWKACSSPERCESERDNASGPRHRHPSCSAAGFRYEFLSSRAETDMDTGMDTGMDTEEDGTANNPLVVSSEEPWRSDPGEKASSHRCRTTTVTATATATAPPTKTTPHQTIRHSERNQRREQQKQYQQQLQPPTISIFSNPIVVRRSDGSAWKEGEGVTCCSSCNTNTTTGKNLPVSLDVRTCEELSYAVIYNLALSHHLRSEELALGAEEPSSQPPSGRARAYLQKAWSLYEYSHEIFRRQSRTIDLLFPALHSMALANNVAQIHHVLGNADQIGLCMHHIISIVLYMVDRGELVLGEGTAGSSTQGPSHGDPLPGGTDHRSEIEHFFDTALRLTSKDRPAASA